MAEFDTIAKHLIHTYPHDFARFALQRDDVEVLGVVDTEQPTVEAHRTDSLIRVRINDEEALVHHEFQTTDSSPPMPRRMAGYIGRGIEQHDLPIYSNVIYLRPDASKALSKASSEAAENAPLKIYSTCWRFALRWPRRIRWPPALGPLTMCSASSSCFGRPYRCRASKPLGTC